VLTFAALYPDDVAGMVLVDSTAPASEAKPETTSPQAKGSYDLMGRVSALASSTARFGVGRLIGLSDYGTLPPQSRAEIRASSSTAGYVQSTINEYVFASASSNEAATLVDFADKPLVVLTAGVGSSAIWMANQEHLVTLSSNSVHRVIEGAIHAGLLLDEQSAAATTRAILDVVSSIRNAEALVE
jgi:pimeloyl-ACP methyl ester carboxylesterase